MSIKLSELQEFKDKYLDKEGKLKGEYVKSFKTLESTGLYDFLMIFLVSCLELLWRVWLPTGYLRPMMCGLTISGSRNIQA